MSDESQGGFGGPRPDHEIYDAFPNEPSIFGTDPKDGLPKPAVNTAIADAFVPPLEVQTFICMADTSWFVFRDERRRIVAKFDPSEVERAPDGTYFVTGKTAMTRFPDVATSPLPLRAEIVVEPIRPACAHYKRQKVDFELDASHRIIRRVCTAQRGENGEFFSVRDNRVQACDMRSPRDLESEERELDAFDKQKIAEGRKRAEDESFDIEKALEAQG